MAEEYSMEEEGGKNAGSMCWDSGISASLPTSNFSPVCCRALKNSAKPIEGAGSNPFYRNLG